MRQESSGFQKGNKFCCLNIANTVDMNTTESLRIDQKPTTYTRLTRDAYQRTVNIPVQVETPQYQCNNMLLGPLKSESSRLDEFSQSSATREVDDYRPVGTHDDLGEGIQRGDGVTST